MKKILSILIVLLIYIYGSTFAYAETKDPFTMINAFDADVLANYDMNCIEYIKGLNNDWALYRGYNFSDEVVSVEIIYMNNKLNSYLDVAILPEGVSEKAILDDEISDIALARGNVYIDVNDKLDKKCSLIIPMRTITTDINGIYDFCISFNNSDICILGIRFITHEARSAFKTFNAVEYDKISADNMLKPDGYIGSVSSDRYILYKNIDFENYGIGGVCLKYATEPSRIGSTINFWIMENGDEISYVENAVPYNSEGQQIGKKLITFTINDAEDYYTFIDSSYRENIKVSQIYDLCLTFSRIGTANIKEFYFFENNENCVGEEIQLSQYEENDGVLVEKNNILKIVKKCAYVKYSVDFGDKGASYIEISGMTYSNGKVFIKLDSLSNNPCAIVPINSGENVWAAPLREHLKTVKGRHDIYVTFCDGLISDYNTLSLSTIKFLNEESYRNVFEGIDIYEPDEATSVKFDTQQKKLRDIENGGCVKFNNLSFGATPEIVKVLIEYSVPSNSCGGKVFVKIDEKQLAEIAIEKTDDFETKKYAVGYITEDISGIHDLSFVFSSSGEGNLGEIHSVKFEKAGFGVKFEQTDTMLNSYFSHCTNVDGNSALIVALYDENGTLVDLNIERGVYTQGEIETVKNSVKIEENSTFFVKGFIFDNLYNLKPLGDSIRYDIIRNFD